MQRQRNKQKEIHGKCQKFQGFVISYDLEDLTDDLAIPQVMMCSGGCPYFYVETADAPWTSHKEQKICLSP